MGILDKIFGDDSSRFVKEVAPLVSKINSLESDFEKLSKREIEVKTKEFKERIAEGASLDDILPEAFALVREASKRTLGQRHFDVQLMGAIALHRGHIAEMRTGEGKTLVATMPLYLNALSGRGAQLITTNDYLARVGVTLMGQIYAYLGLSCAVINHDSSYLYDESHVNKEEDKERDEVGYFRVKYDFLKPCSRAEAYNADITYGTNSEYGFDYLRDNISGTRAQLVQREHHYAIVDEVDSILIDEARTPLIISAPVAESESLYGTFARIANSLKEGEDYEKDEKQRAITLSQAGIDKAEKALGIENIYTEGGVKYVHHLETAVRAKALFTREKEYVIKDGEVMIVDSFTGRLQPGRRWSEGLHQAIEAKEGVKVQQESRTFASITYQNYFRMYEKLAGMTGTAKTSAEEFEKVYGLQVIEIPTNKPMIRIDNPDLIYQTESGKWAAIARQVKELNHKGQPVLIGTVSIERNELLSAYLKKEGIKHEILNAKKHEQEGQIIADAGRKRSVTIATNMAGRGIDIILGGVGGSHEDYEEVRALGGLFVLGTERHEARRIDNQLRGRSGRQGDPGVTRFFVSLDDDLMRIFAADRIKSLMGTFNIPEGMPIESRIVSRQLEAAQQKIEGLHFDARKHILEYDDVMNKQRLTVYERRRKMLLGSEEDVEEFIASIVESESALAKELETKKVELGKEGYLKEVRTLVLQVIDMLWMDHLEAMDYLRSSVRLRAYGQHDPLVEYKREALQGYKILETSIRDQVLHLLPRVGMLKREQEARDMQAIQASAERLVGKSGGGRDSSLTVVKETVGRNDPCPCGSGLKYKKCGMIGANEHKG